MKTTKPVLISLLLCSQNTFQICIVTTITHYLEITKNLRATDQLIISYKKLQKAVTTNTISRWCKVILGKAGIDIEKYSSHSTQASTSKSNQPPQVSEINKAAGWKETSTFRRFYKPIFKTFGDLNVTCFSIFSNPINVS